MENQLDSKVFTEITFDDDTVKPIDINVNSLTLFQLQKEGVINGTFLKGFMKKEADLDPVSILQAIYAAYRQANKKEFIKFEEFINNYTMDIETGIPIYWSVVSKKAKKQFQKSFAEKTFSGKKK